MDNYNRFRMDTTTGYTQEQLNTLNAMFTMRLSDSVYKDSSAVNDLDSIKAIAERVQADFDKNHQGLGKVYNTMRLSDGQYVINFHNGEAVHMDGSPFFHMDVQRRKTIHEKNISWLENHGYTLQD